MRTRSSGWSSRAPGDGLQHRVRLITALDRGLVVEIDADFSHDPRVIPRLVSKIVEGSDLVLSSRYTEGGGVTNWA